MKDKRAMKILLVRPISDTYIISPPIGLGYLATALRRSGHDVKILDCVRDRMTFDDFECFIRKGIYDAVGFQVWSCDLPNVIKSLEIVKRISPDIITIAGGAHPSGLPLEALDHLGKADFAFRGEGEIGLPLLLDALSSGTTAGFSGIPGLIWKESGHVHANPPSFPEDLDQFGMPAWDLIPPASYPHAPHQGFAKAFPIAPVIVTRGCPFLCTFCATHSINGNRIRSRSVDSVIEEIRILKQKYGVNEVHIEDDNFTFNREFLQRFCRALIEEDLGVVWYCSSGVRLDSLDKETLLLMKKAKCYTLTVAIESGSQRVLDLMKKHLTIDKIREMVALINSAGYIPTGLFMFGFPGETKKEMTQTLDFAMGLKLKRAQFAIFHPLPGSKVYDELRKSGRLEGLDWTKLKPSEVACVATEASGKELKDFQRMAFIRFHSRPRILYYQLREIQSVSHLWFLIKRVCDMLSPFK